MKRKLTIAGILFLQLLFLLGKGQNNNIQFNLVEGNNGEPLGRINAITQDPHGYMWFSGQGNGCLYKYDAVRMTTYKPDFLYQKSASKNYMETVYADPSGMIWLGFVNGGMEQFNPVTGIFKNYIHDSADPQSLGEGMVSAILRDHQGRLWVGTANGLDQLDEKTGKFIHYRNEPGNPASLSSSVVRTIYEDREGVLWIGTGFEFKGRFKQYISPDDGGLNRMNTNGKFTRYTHDPKNTNSIINNKVRSIFEDSRGIFWIGTSGDGLHTMDRSTGRFTRHTYNPGNPEQLSRPALKGIGIPDPITFIQEDASGAIWIGTYLSGVNRYDTGTKKITHYEASNGYPDKNCWAGYKSRDGVLWLSSTDPVGFLYRVIPDINKIKDISTVNFITRLQEDKQGYLWASGFQTGLLQFDKDKKLVGIFKQDAMDSVDLMKTDINSIFQNGRDSLWLCTPGGIILFNTKTRTFTWLRYNISADTQSKKFSGINVLQIIEDKKGLKWFSTPQGLFQYNAQNQSLKEYRLDLKDTGTNSSTLTGSMLVDSLQNIWAASTEGVTILDIHTGRLKHFMKGIGIKSLYQDSEGSVWAGSIGKGLFRFNRETDRFDAFFDAQSVMGKETIINIIEDDLKNLWIITNSSIVKLDLDRKGLFIYGKKYGIRPNTLYHGGICKTAKGEILVGNARGFYAISPMEMSDTSKSLQLNITGFFINNLPVFPGQGSMLANPIEETNKITLKYNQNNFSFNFAAIDYRVPEGNQYYTMLENYDSTWREVGGDKSAFYLNIPPGRYVFRLKAINIDNVKAEKAMEVTINPPWWKTWWAYCMYGLLLLMAILGVHRVQKQRTIRAERQKAQVKELAQAKEIEKAYTQLEAAHENLKSTQAQLIQSEKMASLGELTAGIAHEIQNPLNFVNNFSEVNTELVDELEQEAEKGNMDTIKIIAKDIKGNSEKINQHGKRADAIVKSMLQHSRINAGVKEPTDINKLADEYFRLAYHGLRAKDKSFNATLETDYDESIGNINIIPQDIGRVLLNLINNAFYAVAEKKKQQGEDYEPTVSVSTKKSGNNVLVSVKDNGNGIPEKVVDKIFQPFFTTKPTGQGTGLGLSLTYDIIKAHGGEIKVETKEGKGSVFIIQLPIHS